MNWYKMAQSDIQQGKDLGMNYMDIGHSTKDDEFNVTPKFYRKSGRNFLWWWENGQLRVRRIGVSEGEVSHWDFDGDPDTTYTGRAQMVPGGTIVISVSRPIGREYYNIPKTLIRSLYQRFGDNSQIVAFDQ